MTKSIVILGTGGFARECYQWLLDIQSVETDISVRGFLDLQNNLTSFPDLDPLYLGSEEDHAFQDDESLVIGIGDPVLRKTLFEKYEARGVPFFTLVHPSVTIGRNCSLGRGNIFCPGCVLTCDISIGHANLFNLHTTLGHDVQVGDFNVVSSHSDLTGWVRVGDSNVFGSSVILLPRSQVGHRCKIAPGSVVYKGFRDGAIAQGNPAVRIGDNEI